MKQYLKQSAHQYYFWFLSNQLTLTDLRLPHITLGLTKVKLWDLFSGFFYRPDTFPVMKQRH